MPEITAGLVRRPVREQFPRWGDGYAAAVAKEDRWLPHLAPHLPVPVPVATGRPGPGYPFPWSVRRWLPGDTVQAAAAGLPADAWRRARGWALRKCLVTLAGAGGDDPAQRAVPAAVPADPVAG